ncbi:uncharacterized protein [Arachis hypogaea]|uniref:uncharacterized protein n=1 Tax=Arachis hypogaea TaxID=3818 RepID=UPI000DEC1E9F|nr:uncharacterized protein LOC112757249 [Arachis hypogaea]
MKPPNCRKIVLWFNDRLQPVGNEAGILSGVVGMLGSDYTKFPIYEKDWRKVGSRDKIYNECVEVNRYIFVQSWNLNSTPTNNLILLLQELFHFEEDSGGIIKRRPPGITSDHWRWFLDYRNSEETKEKCRKNAENRSKQLYTHTGGSKSLARLGEEEERIAEIEQHDESSRLLSQNDSLAQTLGKEHLGRVCSMGIGPTTSQVFGTNSPQSSIRTQREETQRVLLELQAELAAEKLKKTMDNEVATEKTKRQAMGSALMCLVQR